MLETGAPRGIENAAPDAAPTPSVVLMATILVVEDELFVRQSAEWAIEDMGHTPLMAEDLAEALVHLTATSHIDALFVDIRLNDLVHGGYDVANRAMTYRLGLPVLYTSGSVLTEAMKELFVSGGQFLQKPYSIPNLESAIEGLLLRGASALAVIPAGGF